MSFKYRFILSFVLLEIFFIVLIVTMNFITIRDSSEKLIKQKINSNISFLDQMLVVPLSIYDMASLDNLTNSTTELDYINSIVILDAQDKVLSKSYNFDLIKVEDLLLLKEDQTITPYDLTYEMRYKKIKEGDTLLGSFYIVFDITENTRFISESKKRTIFIIIIEILISTYLSYFIGNRLTKVLTSLSETAEDIGENKQTDIPFQERKDEVGILARSMNQMQIDLRERRKNLKEYAQELNVQKNELIKANKSKDDFLANMSHELKTPLNSINVISSIMMKNTKKLLNEEQVKNLGIINSCGNDLLFLINDVLDVSKLEAGEIQLLNETLDFRSIMEKIRGMFEAQMKTKGIEFIFEYDNNIGYIYSDEQRIKQVVKNLLSNALKFAQNGTVKLIAKDAKDQVEILVKDDGIGIPQDKLEHIFDRFKQVDESTTRNYGGTGLGLAICRELTHLLGGDIQVKSKENEGTIFKVTIAKNSDQVDISQISTQEVDNTITLEAKEEKANNTAPLELKEEKPKEQSTPKESKEQKIDNIASLEVEKKTEKSSTKQSSKDLLMLNNDPINFIKLTIELKKEYKIFQSNNVANFVDQYKNNTGINLAIIDTSLLSSEDLEKIIAKLPIKFILVYENEFDSIENEKIIQKIKKPFNIEDISYKNIT